MQSTNVKFTLNSFEYFLLTIDPKVEFASISNKLNNFAQLNQSNKNIVIEINGVFIDEDLHVIIEKIKSICDNHKIIIYAIAKNKYIQQMHLCDIDVINLPRSNGKINAKLMYNKSLFISEPVRSGIKIENDGDIILTSFVSDNAEVISSGNIHVYSEARGRLIAGNGGDKKAKIFVMKFNPTLVSIAGIYRTLDNELPSNILNKSVYVYLDEKDRLNILPL